MKYDLITSGYCALDRVVKTKTNPEVGKTAIITNNNHSEIYYGGCNVNVAVNLARLNLESAPILRVGEDYESSGLKKFLEENRVSLNAIKKLENVSTSSTYLIETPDNEHITLFHPGAMDNSLFIPYDDDWFKEAKCALMTVASLKDNREFLEKVREFDLPLFLGMKMDSDAFPKTFLKECLESVEVLFTNELEASCLVDIYGVDSCEDLINSLPNIKVVVITKGKNGSSAIYKENNEFKYESVGIAKTEKVIDTVGSGDAFIAGYIYGYLNKKSIKESMELGSTIASFVIEGLGSTTNSPYEDELLKRYRTNFGQEKK
jgi:adenosine kinase